MLPITEARIFNINDLIGWHEKGQLELNPLCIWSEKAKSFLIDTLVRGLSIPPIYLRQITDVAARKTTRQVIDGKERISAIAGFYNNEFPIDPQHNLELGGKFYKDLNEETQIFLLNRNICIWFILTNDDSQLKEIFERQDIDLNYLK